jgi:hypothetical protein
VVHSDLRSVELRGHAPIALARKRQHHPFNGLPQGKLVWWGSQRCCPAVPVPGAIDGDEPAELAPGPVWVRLPSGGHHGVPPFDVDWWYAPATPVLTHIVCNEADQDRNTSMNGDG